MAGSGLALLGPLPAGAVPRRTPVGPTDDPAAEHGAIAGWRQLVLHLSDGHARRVVLVVIEADGHAVAASDMVHTADPVPGTSHVAIRHESVGGRFERDGRFLGTRWLSVGTETDPDEDVADWQSTSSTPSADDESALRRLIDEMRRRQPSTL